MSPSAESPGRRRWVEGGGGVELEGSTVDAEFRTPPAENPVLYQRYNLFLNLL